MSIIAIPVYLLSLMLTTGVRNETCLCIVQLSIATLVIRIGSSEEQLVENATEWFHNNKKRCFEYKTCNNIIKRTVQYFHPFRCLSRSYVNSLQNVNPAQELENT